ncbi:hypothetical protein CVT24_011610 [Panaeolus cyanescens]|uniref:Uncharacterized protein n=1 Tax=Panaeolus cyanescens TaxID=181874 RepID=A0A409YGW2_9AGAR|nr:hypothetical protein CVT24_011610 [Panaeolus cyanescens]
MSSNIPTRLATRPTRLGAIKENENAIGRSIRPGQRAKTLLGGSSNATTAGLTAGTGVSRTTIASRAKALEAAKSSNVKADPLAGKRKREALGEVAVAGNRPIGAGMAGAKGKEKEVFDGVVMKSKGAVTRQPLRTIATRIPPVKKTSVEVEPKKEEATVPQDEMAMMIDRAPQAAIPSLTTRRSNLVKETGVVNAHTRTSSRSIPTRHARDEDLDDEQPAQKKRRTSSVPPEEDPRALEEARLQQEADVHQARLETEMQAFAEEEEADPETSPWDDLDFDDNDDPVMVSEYVQEIFRYLKQVELTTMPNPNYMQNQGELAWKMRGILTDWLIQVHVRFRLLPETLFLCVNLIDRFLSARVVSLAKLQLVGITCMFIAAKFEEVVAPSVTHFLLCADSSYTENEILQAEKYVLKTLDWNLSYPNPFHFLRRISKADEYNVKVRTLAKYLLEIGCLEWRLIAAPPSLMAAAAVWLARIALGMEQWTPNLAHYSSYRESEILGTAKLMLNYILKPVRHEAFYKKYAGKRYLKSSIFMREWALQRWSEGQQVELEDELFRLKAEIKLMREAEEQAQQASTALLDENEQEL